MSERLVTAAELRRQFDGEFASKRIVAPVLHDMLAIRVAGHPYAVRLSELAGLYVDRKITPLPARRTDVLGLAGYRSGFVPVFDLARLLGHPAASGPRWLVVAARAPIGFAFDQFDGHVRVEAEKIVSTDGTEAVLREPGLPRPLIAVTRLVELLEET